MSVNVVIHLNFRGEAAAARVAAPGGFRVMAYDVPAHLPWDQGENAFFVSLGAGTAVEHGAS
ncbi:hypothetical protein ACNF49_31815 [Actinomadura sp. ATCC 39365]